MARSYSVSDTRAVGSQSIMAIWQSGASPSARLRMFEFMLGSSATPADYATRYNIGRQITAASTGGTSLTSNIGTLDPADPASIAAAMGGATGGATVSTAFMNIGVNMRATFRWVAAPTKEIVIPATQYSGFCIVSAAQTTAYNVDSTVMWEES